VILSFEFAVRPIEVGGDKIDELPYLRIKQTRALLLTHFGPNFPVE
jgi:hypothetical protein